MSDLARSTFESEAAWETWLAENHSNSQGLWLQVAKKESGIATVTYQEAVEVALCYGWIDGLRRALDDDYFLQKVTPRLARSRWSRINCDKAEALIAAGRMQPAGMREVERAKADGRWAEAYESSGRIEVPADLQAALDAKPEAKAFFSTISSANRYAVLYRIHGSKKPETRQRNIEKFVAMLADGITIYPQR